MTVEQERVVGAAASREVVEPGVGVCHTPEGDAVDGGMVFDEDFEEFGIPLGKGFLFIVGEAGDIGVGRGGAGGGGFSPTCEDRS